MKVGRLYFLFVVMNSTLKLIFAALGLLLGLAVLVMLIVVEEPNMKIIITMLALGMTSQGISIIDQVGEKEEKIREENSKSE